MRRIPQLLYFVALFLIVILQGCDSSSDKSSGGGKFGMMDTNTPEYAAVEFFEYIYSDKKLDNALAMSTPRMAKLLKSYHTNRNVQRHVLDLVFDKVEIQPEPGNSFGRSEYAESALVTLFFTGTLYDNKVEDIRMVEMIRDGDKWLVDLVYADKYL